jgi:hypothetical protein
LLVFIIVHTTYCKPTTLTWPRRRSPQWRSVPILLLIVIIWLGSSTCWCRSSVAVATHCSDHSGRCTAGLVSNLNLGWLNNLFLLHQSCHIFIRCLPPLLLSFSPLYCYLF